MSKPSVTDVIFDTIRLANHPETDGEHFRALMESARNGVEALEHERDRLAGWKAKAMAVSAQCDIQAVGTLLKVPLGSAIHPAIEPGIRGLLAKLDIARTALQTIADENEYLTVATAEAALSQTKP
jgi:hypothetical protein